MTHSFEEKYCIADHALLLIALETMKYDKGEQTPTTTLEQIITIIMAYREIRIGEMNEEK